MRLSSAEHRSLAMHILCLVEHVLATRELHSKGKVER